MIDGFGSNEDSWNIGEGYDGEFDGDGSGRPGASLVGNAIQVWAILQEKSVTVRGAAVAFNLSDKLVRDAITAHYWMYIDGPDDDPTKQTIELDGD